MVEVVVVGVAVRKVEQPVHGQALAVANLGTSQYAGSQVPRLKASFGQIDDPTDVIDLAADLPSPTGHDEFQPELGS